MTTLLYYKNESNDKYEKLCIKIISCYDIT